MKKYLAIIMALSLCFGLLACGGNQGAPAGQTGGQQQGEEVSLAGTYDIKVWVAEAAVELTEKQIKAFNETNTDGIVINATIEPVGEGDAATQMTTDIEAGADIFCFAQDQTARLVQAGALNKLGKGAQATVTEANDAGVVSAATVAGEMYAYPLTADNGYFMYYDKTVVKEESIEDLAAIVADCEAAGKNFSFELEGSAWYTASFFFATGCTSNWTTDADGNFTSVEDTFNSPEGLVAAKGMKILLDSSIYNNSSQAAEFAAAIPSAVVISGTWDYETAKNALGDNLGVTDLPSFTVDGSTYHIGSFSGCKLLGVKPQTDAVKGAAIHKLAQYLTGEACQTERFNTLAWGPSNLVAQQSEAVQSAPHLAALMAQSPYSVPQGQIHGSWWDIGKAVATNIKAATDDAGLQAALDTYKTAIDGLFSMDEATKNAFTVIGAIKGTSWDTDFTMTQQDDGTWKSDEAFELAAGDEFKVRQGMSWDVAYPADNFKVETAGTYYIVLDPATETVSLVAA